MLEEKYTLVCFGVLSTTLNLSLMCFSSNFFKQTSLYIEIFFVSISLLPDLIRTTHLMNEPLPLPIREFLDFFVNGKFDDIGAQHFFL